VPHERDAEVGQPRRHGRFEVLVGHRGKVYGEAAL
jgi:hypothetical protein